MPKLKVIYDTDPGIDDAMALLLLARHPDVELIGVTSVFGNHTSETTTRNALYLKQLFGFDAPKDSFAWHYLHSQPPGTSETTRFPSDFINGPVLINSIYRLNDRLKLGHADRISPRQKVMIRSINSFLVMVAIANLNRC